jgi:glycosyltransferase involved in cell wall biosynthesis
VNPIRLVHLVLNLRIGGLEQLLIDILTHTDRTTVDPCVLCIGEDGDLAAQVRALGVPVDSLGQPEGRNIRLPFRLARYFRSKGAQVVHAHGPYAHFYAALASFGRRGPKIVNTRHGFLWPETPRARRRNRVASAFSSAVIAVSRDLEDYLLQVEGLPPHKVRMIYNGIDTARFNRSAGGSNGAKAARPTVTMVARMSTEKDFESLLCAAPAIRAQIPDVEIRLVGDGPLRPALEKLASELGLAGTATFLGKRDDVALQLQRSHVFVLSTMTEGLSISLLEAMACGLPIVATSVGGNPEVVVDGQTGFLVPLQSPNELADRIVWLLTHPHQAEAMGSAGRERIAKYFDVRGTAAAYEALYGELIASRPKSSRHVIREQQTCASS